MSLPHYALDCDAVLKDSMSNKDGVWRNGKPDYTKARKLFEAHKSKSHSPGSLEFIVENIIKNWEKEVSHKPNPSQWETVDLANYRFSCNGGQKYTGHEISRQGTYNVLLGETAYYNSKLITFEESHLAFKRTFGEGFAWEVIELYSGPPTVSFKWRHFGRMTGLFSCSNQAGGIYKADATHNMVELYGVCVVKVNEHLMIQDFQIFYDPNQLFTQLTEICPYLPFAKITAPPSHHAELLLDIKTTTKVCTIT
ncbi:unnamed protein product [Didymodactylos carnosus]|uniref:Pathogen-related protein n=1 Tax=Didymodactylos carnosus TaxID=1234261 RepID=A0A815PVN6_9BILA|nr:unnamed protein product [Didymodactylos carnosus]CAF1454599.1 unnamed protein product [Didymodactylos carnosus]CAF4131138.1 unnamed protein product [Didymodactylos carnosus]CAF4326891.1 unnamed protein product [Didymodactylos carnosus]